MSFVKHRVAVVEWVDSCTVDGWHSEPGDRWEPASCRSCGFVVRDDEVCIALALNQGGPNVSPYANVMSIPRVAVKSVRYLGGER